MPETRERILETWGEVAQELGRLLKRPLSVSYVRKLWKKHGFRPKHRLGLRGRVCLTPAEIGRFKKRLCAAQGGGR